MRAGEASCSCPECGVVCEGRYNGCSDVWARGPQSVVLVTQAGPEGAEAGAAGREAAMQPRPTAPSRRLEVAPNLVAEAGPVSADAAHEPDGSGQLRADLRLVVDRMASQQATLSEWRAAIEPQLAAASQLAAVPEQLVETVAEVRRHNERVQATVEAVEGRLEAALAATRQQMTEEREVHLHSTQALVANLLSPLVEEWARTRAQMGALAASLERLPDAVGTALSRMGERQADQLGDRLEQGQREIGKLHQELVMTRLEAVVAEQRQLLQAVEASVVTGMDQVGRDQRSGMADLEKSLCATLNKLLGESLASNVDVLPEILIGAFGHVVEESTRQLVARVGEVSEQNRQEQVELNRAALAAQEKVFLSMAAANELAARQQAEAVNAFLAAQADSARQLAELHERRVEKMAEVDSRLAEHLAALEDRRAEQVAQLQKLCDRMARRLSDSRHRLDQSVEVEALEARLNDFMSELQALQKLTRSIDRKAAPAPASTAVSRSAKGPVKAVAAKPSARGAVAKKAAAPKASTRSTKVRGARSSG